MICLGAFQLSAPSPAIATHALLIAGILSPWSRPARLQDPEETGSHQTSNERQVDDREDPTRQGRVVSNWADRMIDILPGPKQPAIGAPMPVSVIEAEELQQLGIRFLSDALRRVPGVEVTRTSSTESNVSARGYNDVPSSAQGMLALIDGRLGYNPFFGNVFWDALPVAMYEVTRIEVLRGPGSFAFGPNSKDGLVSI